MVAPIRGTDEPAVVRNLTEKPYFSVVSYGGTFGLEPNFPCCTVNHPQAYPKFVAGSYVRDGSEE